MISQIQIHIQTHIYIQIHMYTEFISKYLATETNSQF